METMSVAGKTLWCTNIKRVINRDIWFLTKKRLEPRELPWQWHHGCHFVLFMIYSSCAAFEDYRSSISGDILDSVFNNFSCTVYYAIIFLVCIVQRRQYL